MAGLLRLFACSGSLPQAVNSMIIKINTPGPDFFMILVQSKLNMSEDISNS